MKINATAMTNSTVGCKWLRISFWCAAIALGAADAWATRFTMNPDGVSYLDIGDAYWRGDFHSAINAYWSPLYSWILGLFLKVSRPPTYWEYPVVHLVNFFIYVAALTCFEFFLKEFIDSREQKDGAAGASEVGLPVWAWWVLGYTLFIPSSLKLITLRIVTPDMCVAGLVYLAAGLILRIHRGNARLVTYVLLGVVLGFAYLAKAVMFPLAFVFLAVAAFCPGRFQKRATRTAISLFVFLAITAPFILAISHAKGRLTFGESGGLTYAACINGVDPWYPGDGGRMVCQGTGYVENVDAPSEISNVLRHPAVRIFDSPAAYQFATPIGGTYPFWCDPSYWQDGVKPHFDLRGQLSATETVLLSYLWLIFSPSLGLSLTLGVLVLSLLALHPSKTLILAAKSWPLLIPGLMGLFLYITVRVEGRYIGGFLPLVWIAIYSGVRLPSSAVSKRFPGGVVAVAALVIAVVATCSTIANLSQNTQTRPAYWKAAQALAERGILSGDKIAIISDDPTGEGGPYVARLARVQIIGQVNRPDEFFRSDLSTQIRLLDAFANTGASAVLTWTKPGHARSRAEWQNLGGTDYFVRSLSAGPKGGSFLDAQRQKH